MDYCHNQIQQNRVIVTALKKNEPSFKPSEREAWTHISMFTAKKKYSVCYTAFMSVSYFYFYFWASCLNTQLLHFILVVIPTGMLNNSEFGMKCRAIFWEQSLCLAWILTVFVSGPVSLVTDAQCDSVLRCVSLQSCTHCVLSDTGSQEMDWSIILFSVCPMGKDKLGRNILFTVEYYTGKKKKKSFTLLFNSSYLIPVQRSFITFSCPP